MLPQQYELRDADGSLTTFDGVLLGHASSKNRPDQPRWTELAIYRTLGGNYVVHKVGKSSKPGEVDRDTLLVSTAPAGAVESCKTSDSDGALFFTYVAREALDQAVENDPELAEAFYHRVLS